MDKKSKTMLLISIISLAIAVTAVTYAYFSARITGIESASTISLNAGTMGIVYEEGNETVTASNMYPRSAPWITKTFTLTGNNTTAQIMEYEVGLQIITNTFKGGQLSFSLEVGNSNVGTSMSAVNYKPITKTSGTMLIGRGAFPAPVTDGVQTYTLKIYFLDTGKNQNINQGAVFNAKITVAEKGSIVAVNECIDTAHTTLTQGDEYVNGQYTYRYMQAHKKFKSGMMYTVGWRNITDDGWGVILTDLASTDSVTTPLCTSINGKPIVSMSYMFSSAFNGSQATSIDLSSFDTSSVTDMSNMFLGSAATNLDLSSFDTSGVTDMGSMFQSSAATTLDLRNFDTSNVTNMDGMFQGSAATTLDLRNFDTSNVTNMGNMFSYSEATSIDLSSFDTSNVTDMYGMFSYSEATSIYLSSFDTSSVTNMQFMFNNSAVTTLDLSSFDTSNVTSMESMFQGSAVRTLDLSSFDTSSVTNMQYMFNNSEATSIDLSSFDTSSVTNMKYMFGSSAATTLDLSTFDTSNVTNVDSMFRGSAATAGYARTQADADKFNNSSDKPTGLTFVVKS